MKQFVTTPSGRIETRHRREIEKRTLSRPPVDAYWRSGWLWGSRKCANMAAFSVERSWKTGCRLKRFESRERRKLAPCGIQTEVQNLGRCCGPHSGSPPSGTAPWCSVRSGLESNTGQDVRTLYCLKKESLCPPPLIETSHPGAKR